MIFWSGSCRNMRILFAVDMAAFEPGGSRAEDKIGRTFYIAVLIVLKAVVTVGKQDVLVADDAAVFEKGVVAAHFQPYGLAGRKTGIIAEADILRLEISGRDDKAG